MEVDLIHEKVHYSCVLSSTRTDPFFSGQSVYDLLPQGAQARNPKLKF